MQNILLMSCSGLKLALFLYYAIWLLLDYQSSQDTNNFLNQKVDYLWLFCNLLIAKGINLSIRQLLLKAGFIFYYGNFSE